MILIYSFIILKYLQLKKMGFYKFIQEKLNVLIILFVLNDFRLENLLD